MVFTRMKFAIGTAEQAVALQRHLNSLGYFWSNDHHKDGDIKNITSRYFYTNEEGDIQCGDTRAYFDKQTHLEMALQFEATVIVSSFKPVKLVVDGHTFTKEEAIAYIQKTY